MLSASLLLASGHARAQQPVDIELLLAVDSSTSIDRNEFDQQLHGLAEAFRSPLVGIAIEALSPRGGVAVALMQWSGSQEQHLSAPWRLLQSREDALAFADYLDATPRFIQGGSTAIGEALRVGLISLDSNLYAGQRRVIDVSGDGASNEGDDPAVWRDRLVAAGVTINGLAILNEAPNLLRVYQDQVIGGPQAFAVSAADYEAYGAAIEHKLLQELGPPKFVEGLAAPSAEP
ncbi:MAG: DUF1194 domain-containing protein [Pseudomonadota bacterium]